MDEPRKKSLREVLPKKTSPRRPRTSKSAEAHEPERPEASPKPAQFSPFGQHGHATDNNSYRLKEFKQGRSKRSKLAVIVLSSIIILFVAGTLVFQHSTINVSIRTEEAILNDPQAITVVAKTDTESSATSSVVYFGLMQKTISATTSVPANGTKKVSTKASGQITIYNNFSTAVQPLVSGTRFATSDGKIFKLTNSVKVPGLKGTTPGTITASVVADTAGPSYNIGASDFTIPGFKSTPPKYTKIYGRSTSAMTGGLVGNEPVITLADKASADQQLKSQLVGLVNKLTTSQPPNGFILLDGAQTVVYNDSVQAPGNGSDNSTSASVSQSAVITLVLLDRASLSNYLVKKAVTDYHDEPVDIKDGTALKATITSKDKLDLNTTTKISLTLKGKATVVWILDKDALKKALAGLTESSYPSALAQFPAVSKSSITFTPPWFRYLPKNTSRITVITDQEVTN